MEVKDQQFKIQGVSLIDLAQEYGTPLYVYDGEKILEKVKLLQKSFSGVNLKIKYATKARQKIVSAGHQSASCGRCHSCQ